VYNNKDYCIVSIITNTKNDINLLNETAKSILDVFFEKTEVEWLIWDAGDADLGEILDYDYNVDVVCRRASDDKGLYDGLNKAISLAKGEYVIVINSGDLIKVGFIEAVRKLKIIHESLDDVDILACGVQTWKGEIFKPTFDLDLFIHQGLIYKKKLHDKFGGYTVIKGFTASDYLFFVNVMCDEDVHMTVIDDVISYYDKPGMSSNYLHLMQRDIIRASRYNWGISKFAAISIISAIKLVVRKYLDNIIRR